MKSLDREYFTNPTTNPDFSLSAFWFWNDLITEGKMAEQLNIMNRIHADQPVVHARYGLLNEYLSEGWFSLIANAVETARKNGQRLWLYDELNWPSGNCGWSLTKSERLREHFLQFDDNGEARIETDPYEPVGKFNIDYLSHEAIAEFLKSTHEKYKERFGDEFGGMIRGVFMDETRFCNAMPWTSALPEEFKRRKGYNLVPLLPLLRHEDDKSAYVRYDYYDVVSDLYAEATYKQVYDWCEANGLETTAHLLGEETIATQSYFGADALRTVKYMHVPGIDHLGNGIGSLDAKFVVSAAAHYGRDRVMCEAFGASGWDMRYEDVVKISNWLFQQGINLIIMHGFYYSIRDERYNDFPPSYFYQWRDWDRMPEYALMANRMSEMLSGGRREADILVYSPIESYWRHVRHDLDTKTGFWKDGPKIENENAVKIDRQFQLLCCCLDEENLAYHILGSDAAGQFRAENGKLVNINTGGCYGVLVMPLVSVLTEEMSDLVARFKRAGGKIILMDSPMDVVVAKDGRHMRQKLQGPSVDELDDVKTIEDVVKLCRSLLEGQSCLKILEGTKTNKHSLPAYPANLIDPYVHDGERVTGVAFSRYRRADGLIWQITNYNNTPERLKLWLSGNAPETLNPETGEIEKLYGKAEGGAHEVEIILSPNRTRFLFVAD